MKIKTILIIILLISIKSIYSLDYTIPPNTYSIQSGDIDNDGDEDIVVGHINPGTLSFLVNNGDGLFSINGTLNLTGIAICYIVTNLDDNPAEDTVIYSRNEIAGFVTIVYNGEYQLPFSYNLNLGINTPIPAMSYGDFDGDEDFDLVFSSWGAGLDNLWGIMYNLGDREFSEPEWFECPNQAGNAGFYELECRDLDNNGFDDIIAYTPLETYLYYSNGNSFELDSLYCYAPNGGMVSEDFDNDSDYDIIVTHWPGGTQSHFLIYENLEDHQFSLHDVTYDNLWGQPISVDINGDGLFDIVNVGNANGISIFYNIENMQFDEAVYEPVISYGENYYRSSFSDFDGNGAEDVAIIRYGIEENNLTILYNDGEGNFFEEPQASVDNYELEITNYELSNYPNPFNPVTNIYFYIKDNETGVLSIYNIKGQLIESYQFEAGQNNYSWNAHEQSSGIYFYKLQTENITVVKKMVLLK